MCSAYTLEFHSRLTTSHRWAMLSSYSSILSIDITDNVKKSLEGFDGPLGFHAITFLLRSVGQATRSRMY